MLKQKFEMPRAKAGYMCTVVEIDQNILNVLCKAHRAIADFVSAVKKSSFFG